MKVGEIYVHSGNRREYVIVGIAKLKNNQTRKWEDAVIYTEVPSGAFERTIYVREERDFKKRFTQVHPPVHTP